MANELDQFNLTQAGTLPPELYQQQQALNRQQQMAAMLMQQNQQPQGQMVSGRYVPTSFFQNLQPVANMLTGAYLAKQGDTKAAQLAEQLRAGREAEKQAAIQAIQKGDVTGALGLPNQYGGVTPFQSALVKSAIPEQPTSMREFTEAVRNPEYAKFLQLQNQAKGTNISVNTGQHGFDNALKLRTDFRNEPVYKGFEETKAAKNQIDQAATMATPAGDLAAATKIMKILDPGSVVRESELGMAMAATGVEDRVRNYANMVITGEKLTPTQRKDFVELSNKLYNASAEQFNQKRGEYAGIAERNKLDVEAAVGAPAKIKSKEFSVQDQQALQWANSNPNDPRAAKIKKRLGQQ